MWLPGSRMRLSEWDLTLKTPGGSQTSTASSGNGGFHSGCLLFGWYQLFPPGRKIRCLLSLASCLCVYVSDSRWLYYSTPLALHPGQKRAQPRIRCLLTKSFVEPSKLFSSLRFHVLLNYCCALQALPQLPSATSGPSLDHRQGARKCGSFPLLEEDSRCGL